MSIDTQSITAAQEQLLESIRQGQQAVLDAVRTWTEATEGVASNRPTVPGDLPEPTKVVASTFDLAEKLLANQREFAEALVAATANKPASNKPVPKKPAANKFAGHKPVASKSAANKPAAKKPAAIKSAASKPPANKAGSGN